MTHDKILIVDFGSQVTQLIARRVREEGVYCAIVPFQKAEAAFDEMQPRGVILSGGPESVHEAGSPRAPQKIFEAGVPVLGICYGQMTMAAQLGGTVEGGHHREFGRADVEVKAPSRLLDDVWRAGEHYPVWMSHGDRITKMPPGFQVAGVSPNAPFAVIQDEKRKYYGLMFHPEVVHTPHGAALLRNFVRKISGARGDWTMRAFKDEAIEKIRKQVGKGRVICGLSGGVDSSVVAVLIHEAIGEQLTCVFVDHGLLRLGEGEQVVTLFRDHYNIPLVHVQAEKLFLDALGGELGLPEKFVGRHPFPGPGLAIRCPGEITAEKLDILRLADSIYIEEIRRAGLYDDIWQAFAVILPVKTVGVMGDGRTYDFVVGLRAVTSTDGMTADFYPFDMTFIGHVATRIINEVKGVNRVVYDVTSKPPGTIEWE